MDMTGRVAIVTGSSRGIGWACAQRLAGCGATVVLNGRNEAQLGGRLAELREVHPGAHTVSAFDVGDSKAVSSAYRAIASRFGRLDVLINNSGILGDALIGMISDSEMDRVLSTNVKGVIGNLQAAARLMMKSKSGSIVNLSSIVGRVGNQGQLLYSASKAAVIGLTLTAAKELGPHGIRVNAVAPGYIQTDMVQHLPPERQRALMSGIAMGRAGLPDDVADVAVFLASDQARYVSGQVIGVDGCMTL